MYGTGLYGTGLYGTGFRYPRARREVTALYSDPEYLDKWSRAALLNTGLAKKNKWVQYLKETGTYDKISAILQEAGKNYRATHGVSPSTLKNIERRKAKLQALVHDADTRFDKYRAEYERRNYPGYLESKKRIIDRINRELDKLNQLEASTPR